mmetsp:Transcript_43825/g.68536  ORF Transcript_43825/g.68536 Transcript_43825/m.68536 type:complete len:308 (-) Transcript_43825:361-1284(-)
MVLNNLWVAADPLHEVLPHLRVLAPHCSAPRFVCLRYHAPLLLLLPRLLVAFLRGVSVEERLLVVAAQLVPLVLRQEPAQLLFQVQRRLPAGLALVVDLVEQVLGRQQLAHLQRVGLLEAGQLVDQRQPLLLQLAAHPVLALEELLLALLDLRGQPVGGGLQLAVGAALALVGGLVAAGVRAEHLVVVRAHVFDCPVEGHLHLLHGLPVPLDLVQQLALLLLRPLRCRPLASDLVPQPQQLRLHEGPVLTHYLLFLFPAGENLPMVLFQVAQLGLELKSESNVPGVALRHPVFFSLCFLSDNVKTSK